VEDFIKRITKSLATWFRMLFLTYCSDHFFDQSEAALSDRVTFFSHSVTITGGCIFKKAEREFVLKDPSLNIWAGVREDSISYFNRCDPDLTGFQNLSGLGSQPTGHILSSQIACINHLYFVRQRKDIATAILQNVDNNVKSALLLEDGAADHRYVDYEVIGSVTRNFWLYFKKTN